MFIFLKNWSGPLLSPIPPKPGIYPSLSWQCLSWHRKSTKNKHYSLLNVSGISLKKLPSYLSEGIPLHNRKALGFSVEAFSVLEIQMLIFSACTLNFQVLERYIDEFILFFLIPHKEHSVSLLCQMSRLRDRDEGSPTAASWWRGQCGSEGSLGPWMPNSQHHGTVSSR